MGKNFEKCSTYQNESLEMAKWNIRPKSFGDFFVACNIMGLIGLTS